MITKTKHILFIACGWFSVLLGVVGAFLPLLPTTPFLLLAAFLFSKSSPRFHTWLVSHPKLGPPVLDWQKNHIIRPKAKALCAVMLGCSSLVVHVFAPVPIALKLSIDGVLLGVLCFIVTRPSS